MFLTYKNLIIQEYEKAGCHCLGWVIECLINDEEITPTEYISCTNFLVKQKVLYQCNVSFQQFFFETNYFQMKREDIIEKLKNIVRLLIKNDT